MPGIFSDPRQVNKVFKFRKDGLETLLLQEKAHTDLKIYAAQVPPKKLTSLADHLAAVVLDAQRPSKLDFEIGKPVEIFIALDNITNHRELQRQIKSLKDQLAQQGIYGVNIRYRLNGQTVSGLGSTRRLLDALQGKVNDPALNELRQALQSLQEVDHRLKHLSNDNQDSNPGQLLKQSDQAIARVQKAITQLEQQIPEGEAGDPQRAMLRQIVFLFEQDSHKFPTEGVIEQIAQELDQGKVILGENHGSATARIIAMELMRRQKVSKLFIELLGGKINLDNSKDTDSSTSTEGPGSLAVFQGMATNPISWPDVIKFAVDSKKVSEVHGFDVANEGPPHATTPAGLNKRDAAMAEYLANHTDADDTGVLIINGAYHLESRHPERPSEKTLTSQANLTQVHFFA
ncbi:MAG: hypothetical protein AAFR61_25225 [Bacteroidota bacterium]